MNRTHIDVRIETPRLMLRTLGLSDATQEYADWLNDVDVNRYLETKGATVASIKEYIRERMNKTDVVLLGMFTKAGKHIGTVKIDEIDAEEGHATTAIMIGDKASWGQGLGPEAICAIVRHAFDEMGLKRVDLGVAPEHQGAIRAYSKVGFYEVDRRPVLRSGGEWRENVFMSVTPETFSPYTK